MAPVPLPKRYHRAKGIICILQPCTVVSTWQEARTRKEAQFQEVHSLFLFLFLVVYIFTCRASLIKKGAEGNEGVSEEQERRKKIEGRRYMSSKSNGPTNGLCNC